jgi:membrane protease YdiL (CAAX protease family)
MKSWIRRQSTTTVVFGYTAWVAVMFVAAQVLVGVIIGLLALAGVPVEKLNTVTGILWASVASYGLALAAVIWLPKKLFGITTNWREVGLDRLPKWLDLLLGPVVFVPYIFVSGIVLTLVSNLAPSVDWAEKQDLGFSAGIVGVELGVAFVLLVILAPLVEETLFRGYFFGKLRRRTNLIISSLVVSLVFGVLHMQINVAVDVFVLSMALCMLREFTGSIWAGVLLHMTKNGFAFYVLFINPSFLSTLGG